MSRLTTRLGVATVGAAALALAVAPAAGAHGTSQRHHHHHPQKWHRTLSTDVLAPFQIAVDRGKVYVADGATSQVSRIDKKKLTVLVQGPQPGEVAGLDVIDGGRTIAYTTTDYSNGNTTLTIQRKGRADVVADLSGYEQQHNPDGKVTYGLQHTASTDCAAGQAWLGDATGVPATYQGVVDSHPYAVVSLGHGWWAVADAAGNDILAVSPTGTVRTMALLPRQMSTLTKDALSALGAPDEAMCLTGKTYAFEPVPTDVERGKWGGLYVSTLPGGPEDPSLGARGSVYTVNPWTGKSHRMATGFLGATNLAVAGDGTAYVTELFGGKITKVNWWGRTSTFKKVDSPLAVEVHGNTVYAATMGSMDDEGNPTGPGSVLKYRR